MLTKKFALNVKDHEQGFLQISINGNIFVKILLDNIKRDNFLKEGLFIFFLRVIVRYH